MTVVPPVATAARSARGDGRVATAPASAEVSAAEAPIDWTVATTAPAPPPKTTSRPPITAPAASCTGAARDPAGWLWPVVGSMSTTARLETLAGPSPPSTRTLPPDGRATARDSAVARCQGAGARWKTSGTAGLAGFPGAPADLGDGARGLDDDGVARYATRATRAVRTRPTPTR